LTIFSNYVKREGNKIYIPTNQLFLLSGKEGDARSGREKKIK